MERNAVKAVGHIKDTVAHIVILKIRLEIVLGEVEFGSLGLLEVVSPVSGCQFIIDSLSLGDRIHIGELTLCGFQSGSPELVKETVDSLGSLGHAVLKNELGIVVKTHDPGFLIVEVHHLHDNGLVVIAIAVIATVQVSVEEFCPKHAVVVKLEERHDTGIVQSECPPAIHSLVRSPCRSRCHCRCRQTGKVILILNHQREVRRLLQHILLEKQLKFGKTGIDLTELLLLVFRKSGSGTLIAFVRLCQQTHLVLLQSECVPAVIYSLDAPEQLFVHGYPIEMVTDDRHQFCLKRHQLRCGVYGRPV